MQLPKELTTVTPLSKYLALSLFVLLPILAFFLGMRYSQIIYTDMLPQVAYTRGESNNTPSPSPDFSNWKTYRDNRFNFSLEYPSSLNVEKNEWGILISNNDMRFIVAVDGGLTITYDASTSQNTIVDEFPGIKNEYYHPSTLVLALAR